MKKMNQGIILALLVCLAQIKSITGVIPYAVWPDARFLARANAPLDCSQYSHDYEILSSFEFITYINPLAPAYTDAYAKMDANENVYYLRVMYQNYLPTTVFCLKFLQELYVQRTNFYESESDNDTVRRLPSQIELLAPSLTSLTVLFTTISHLPEQIGKLTRLLQLDLSYTGLVALPDSIGNLSALSYLYLDGNRLTSLPATMANMRALSYITLNYNLKLHSIQALNGLPSLQILYTIDCPIERLPLNLPRLSYLYMFNNSLTDLINIATLGNDTGSNKFFYFHTNRIRFIPPQIRYVRHLHTLDLNTNQLATLPTEIFNMTTLQNLYIRNNLFSGPELKAIVAKFNSTNPTTNLFWSNITSTLIKTD